jgi:hypothetical protein
VIHVGGDFDGSSQAMESALLKVFIPELSKQIRGICAHCGYRVIKVKICTDGDCKSHAILDNVCCCLISVDEWTDLSVEWMLLFCVQEAKKAESILEGRYDDANHAAKGFYNKCEKHLAKFIPKETITVIATDVQSWFYTVTRFDKHEERKWIYKQEQHSMCVCIHIYAFFLNREARLQKWAEEKARSYFLNWINHRRLVLDKKK